MTVKNKFYTNGFIAVPRWTSFEWPYKVHTYHVRLVWLVIRLEDTVMLLEGGKADH